MIDETPLSVLPLPEGFYFEIVPAPKHSIWKTLVQVRKQGFPFSHIVASAGYNDPKDAELERNWLSSEVWAWYDREENR